MGGAVERHVADDPAGVGLFRPVAVALSLTEGSNLAEEGRRTVRRRGRHGERETNVGGKGAEFDPRSAGLYC